MGFELPQHPLKPRSICRVVLRRVVVAVEADEACRDRFVVELEQPSDVICYRLDLGAPRVREEVWSLGGLHFDVPRSTIAEFDHPRTRRLPEVHFR
jgi:hypothetical protein